MILVPQVLPRLSIDRCWCCGQRAQAQRVIVPAIDLQPRRRWQPCGHLELPQKPAAVTAVAIRQNTTFPREPNHV